MIVLKLVVGGAGNLIRKVCYFFFCRTQQEYRRNLGCFGVTGDLALQRIGYGLRQFLLLYIAVFVSVV